MQMAAGTGNGETAGRDGARGGLSSSPVLVIDAGNTSTSVGLYLPGGRRVVGKTAVRGGIATCRDGCAAAIRTALGAARGASPRLAMMASVTPALDGLWSALVRDEASLRLGLVRHDMRLPFRFGYARPETTGADRIANVAAAVVLGGAPALVVDIGTAVTYDVVSAGKVFSTGAIGPGPDVLVRSLHDHTALLPLVDWRSKEPPARPVDTEGAMLYGFDAGFRGMLRETVSRLLPEVGAGARLVATGGFAGRFVAPLGMGFVIDPDLTLRGVGLLSHYQDQHT